jgi:hypothetical protein
MGGNDALVKGLLGQSGGPPDAPEDSSGDEDMEILYDEFKNAQDSKSALRALKQLVRGMK